MTRETSAQPKSAETSAQPKAPTDPKEVVERLSKARRAFENWHSVHGWRGNERTPDRSVSAHEGTSIECAGCALLIESDAAASLIESLAASVAEYRGLCVDHEQVERNLLRERESLAGELDEAKYAIGAILPYAQDSGWGISSESEWKAALSIARRARCPHPEVHSPENTPCQWCGE